MALPRKQQKEKLNFLLIVICFSELHSRQKFPIGHHLALNTLPQRKAEMLLDPENNKIPPVLIYPFFPWVMSCLLQPPPKIELKLFITCSPAGPQPACTLSSFSGSLSPQLTPGLIQWPTTSGSQCVPSAEIHCGFPPTPECQLPLPLNL